MRPARQVHLARRTAIAVLLALPIACGDAGPVTGPGPDPPGDPAPAVPRIGGLWLARIAWTQDLCNPALPAPIDVEVEIGQVGDQVVFLGRASITGALSGVAGPDGALSLEAESGAGTSAFTGRVDRALDDDRIVGTEQQRLVAGDQVCLVERSWAMDRASEFGG